MKAEDFMIGDWIIRRGVPEEPMRLYDMKATAGIVYLDQDGRGVTEKFENIEPIPLTYDILESNFGPSEKTLNVDPHYLFYSKNGKFMIGVQLKPWPDCKKLLEVFNYDTNRGMKYECNRLDDVEQPFYVHELQHLLKLCKIEKEITI